MNRKIVDVGLKEIAQKQVEAVVQRPGV